MFLFTWKLQVRQEKLYAGRLNPDSVEVYSLDGKLVRSVTVDSDEIHIKVEAGVYMVKAGEYTVKVIVKIMTKYL